MEPADDNDLTLLEEIMSTVARILLGGRLKALRKKARVRPLDAARHAGMNKTTMWRFERGDLRCRYKPGDVHVLAELYKADDEERQLLLALARATQNQTSSGTILPDVVERYINLESYANRIRWYSPHVIPDPLQTIDYAITAAHTRSGPVGKQLRDIVQVHPFRQSRLMANETAKEAAFAFVMDEAVLHHSVGSSWQMARQLREILIVMERPHVSVRVYPFSERAPAGLFTGPFIILDFPPVPLLDALPPAVYRDPATPIERLEAAALPGLFGHLQDDALDEQASHDLIESAVKRFESG